MGCCCKENTKEAKIDALKDGAILEDRSCTDICMIFVAMVFIIGWIVVGAVAVSLGRPSRILLPENFRGDLCGDEGAPNEDVPNLFVPKPSRLEYGICISECPAVGDYVCNNDFEYLVNDTNQEGQEVRNDYYNHKAAEYETGFQALTTCALGTCTAQEQEDANRYEGLVVKLTEYKCFFAFYNSGPTLFRCLPGQSDESVNTTLAEQAGDSNTTLGKLNEFLGVGAFFTRGFGEMYQCRWVMGICGITALVLSVLWICLLRCILAPIVYLSLILIFCILIAIGYFAKLMADDLEDIQLPGDTATEDQVTLWRIIQFGFWIAAGIYFVVMLWMLKRIRIGIAVMKHGSRCFSNNIGLVLIPPIVFVIVIGWIFFFLIMTLYIQTIGTVTESDFTTAASDTFGDTAYNATVGLSNSLANLTRSNTTTVNTTAWTSDDITKIMHAYNFFGFLWSANFCICWGFFVQALVAATWYFSASTADIIMADEGNEGGRYKSTPAGTVCKSFCAVLKNHIGTLLWGSLLIAIIQFIRVVFLYLQEEFLDRWKEMDLVKCILYVINCCLEYIERVIKVISKNAFIVCCMTNEGFCSCAATAIEILVSNAARVGVLAFMSTIAYFILKLFIVVCNMIVAWALINQTSLTDNRDVESGLFPMVFIFVATFIIASLFVSVYESCTDTIMMCFLWDDVTLDGHFMPKDLSKLTDSFAEADKKRREYEATQNQALKDHKNPKYEDTD